LFAAPLLAIAALGALPLIHAEAAAAPEADVTVEMPLAASNCTYYNNAQHSVIVGQFGYDCCNNRVAWGKKTAFKECGGCFICFPPPR
jgi:hypothetical protein